MDVLAAKYYAHRSGPGTCRGYPLESHTIAGDGTHTSVALDVKTHSCRIRSSFHCNDSDIDLPDAMRPHAHFKGTWAVLQRIPAHNGCIEQRAISTKQVINIGVVPWADDEWLWSTYSLNDSASPESSYFPVRWYLFAVDQGADQGGCDGLMDSDVSGTLLVFKMRSGCLRRVLNLICRTTLVRVDSKVHFTMTFTIANTWRSARSPKKIFKSYVRLFGYERARSVAATLTQRALRSRWGFVFEKRGMLIECGDKLKSVWEDAFPATGLGGRARRATLVADDGESYV